MDSVKQNVHREDPKPRVRWIEVDAAGDGQRVDNYLLRVLKGVPRTHVYRLLRTGEVRVNKGRVKPDRRLAEGDQIRLPPVRQGSATPVNVNQVQKNKILKTIIYEDNKLLILNKPSGLAVHGGSGLSHGAIEALRAARPVEQQLELVHRLDRDTSGCLMVARRRSGLRSLQELQREGAIDKRYLALLAGQIRTRRFTIKAPLQKNRLQSGERVVRVDEDGQRAVTHFEVIDRFPDATLVRARLETGRTHQIRVHAAHHGHAVLGDEKYGEREVNRSWRRNGLKRLFLHAASLELPWGDDDARLKVEAPLPDELSRVLKRLEHH